MDVINGSIHDTVMKAHFNFLYLYNSFLLTIFLNLRVLYSKWFNIVYGHEGSIQQNFITSGYCIINLHILKIYLEGIQFLEISCVFT